MAESKKEAAEGRDGREGGERAPDNRENVTGSRPKEDVL